MSRLKKVVSRIPLWRRLFSGKYQTHLTSVISDVLAKRGISQRELADQLGCSQAYVSQLLSGEANMTVKTLSKIEAAIGLEILLLNPEFAGREYRWLNREHQLFRMIGPHSALVTTNKSAQAYVFPGQATTPTRIEHDLKTWVNNTSEGSPLPTICLS